MDDSAEEIREHSSFLPMVVFGAAVIVTVASQLNMIGREREQLQATIVQQQAQLDQAARTTQQANKLISELRNLSGTNRNAAEILKRHGVATDQPGMNPPPH